MMMMMMPVSKAYVSEIRDEIHQGKNFRTVRNSQPQNAPKDLQQSYNIVDTSNILGE